MSRQPEMCPMIRIHASTYVIKCDSCVMSTWEAPSAHNLYVNSGWQTTTLNYGIVVVDGC